MNERIGLFAGLTALFAMGSAHAQAFVCPTTPVNAGTNVATGHVFETYSAPGVTWSQAKVCAGLKTVGGAQGHLATITSSAEDAYVNGLKRDNIDGGVGTFALPGEVWVGGSQASGTGNSYDGWRWENNEGPIPVPGLTIGPDPYSNWLPGEPNDNYGLDSENYLAIGLNSSTSGWNDEGALGNITGFIVEYDVPRNAACTVGVNCQTIDGQTLIFPTGSFQTGQTIKFTAYEFADPRVINGKCTTRQTLNVLTDPAFKDENGDPAPLKIPPYLCGSPKFVVVAVDSSQLNILKGTVFVENQTTEKVLPNNLYKCFDPILGSLLTGDSRYSSDPQYQDVVVWQSTNPTKMAENATTLLTYTGNPDYIGAATEATNGCASTVAKVRGASYFVVGMHIDFGGAFDYPANSLGNYQQFVALTQYKLSLLKQSVANARAAGSVTNPDGQAMASQVQNAINSLTANDPVSALKSMTQFLKKVNTSTYKFPLSVTFNYNGDHLMRGENIAFTLRVKVIPYKQP